ncbi:MAG: hypothetical protein JJV97_02560 [SAR324 cluster bacterium]|nr:hypothetical protein [SAR324 cluster bacterium]
MRLSDYWSTNIILTNLYLISFLSLLLHLIAIIFLGVVLFYGLKKTPPKQPSASIIEILDSPKTIPKKPLPLQDKIDNKKIFGKDIVVKKPPEKITNKDSLYDENNNKSVPTLKKDLSYKKNDPSPSRHLLNPVEQYGFLPPHKIKSKLNDNNIPLEISKHLPADKSLSTNQKNLNYALSNYQWSFETYVEQWAAKIIKWWGMPGDYAAGKIPDGGSLWVSVRINKLGELLHFKIINSKVSGEMELKVLQGLIASFELPLLPDDFPDEVTFHWEFIYPPYHLLKLAK